MAKITHRGTWLKISSLNPEDKKNYLIAMALFFTGALAWGVHLASVGVFYDIPDTENATSTIYNLARLIVVILWSMATFFYFKFLRTQDELIIKWHDFIMSWGAVGFLTFGMLMSLLSPYLNFKPGFYELFIAFGVGTVIGGLRFHNKFLS